LSSQNAPYLDRPHAFGALILPLLRQFWMIVLIVTVGALSSLSYSRMQAPSFEASAVVQTLPGVDVAAAKARVTARANLLAMVQRHHINAGESADRSAVRLRQSIAVRDLTSDAGSTLGLAPEVSGIVASVLWPDAEVSARIANDLAQQILDAGNAGQISEHNDEMEFYRREEQRLWQETGALKAELEMVRRSNDPGAAQQRLGDGRQLALMQDQYALVRERLAAFEVDARLAGALQAGQFSLLQRATSTEAVSVVRNWMLVGVAGSLLLAVALVFVLERRYPSLQRGPWDDFAAANQRMAQLYRVFDDPARPILGLPRFAVATGVVVAWLIAIAVMLR
jgi:uncharacterized protein involved in exopolysaccharide biosynthesis